MADGVACAVSGAARTVSHQPGPVGSVLRFCGSRTIPPNMTAIPAEVTATLAPCRAIGHVGDGAVSACSTPLAASECSRSGSSVITGRECHGPFAAACNDLSHEFAGSVRGHCESLAVSGTLADGLTRICSAVSSSR